MSKFRKKTEPVEAIQFNGVNFDELEKFVGGDAEVRSGQIVLAARNGAVYANRGDWIIKDSNGRCQSFKPDFFAAMYEGI